MEDFGENILDALYEDDNTMDDIEMLDVEEGELVDHHQNGVVAKDHNLVNETDCNNNQKPKSLNRNRRRKVNKRKKKGLGSDSININRFVQETCRRLREKKLYMVYTAVGCLGISALRELVKEVDVIQSCGGQKTADGKRFRTGGGVLWNIIKVREPNAYKEIMNKTREFEKQFRQRSYGQPPMQQKEDSSQGVPCTFSSRHLGNVSNNTSCTSQLQDQPKPPGSEEKRVLVHDRLRIPVSYDDDLLLGTSTDNDATLP
ncbi:unnamed protein product [Vicia faba]|uniref:Phosphorylated adapter RNA export protein n=1 Tax=Vicia faba TaxID=3906 RepID=A0AAV1A963_VICFA|nr:unnamed protein product [Vicia faba]